MKRLLPFACFLHKIALHGGSMPVAKYPGKKRKALAQRFTLPIEGTTSSLRFPQHTKNTTAQYGIKVNRTTIKTSWYSA